MKIQPSSMQRTDMSGNVGQAGSSRFVEPKDTVQINADSGSVHSSMSSLTSKGVTRKFVAKVLMGNRKVDAIPLDQADKIIHKAQTWVSERMHGTFSTGVVYCPVGNCYYTGMIGEGNSDKAVGKKYLTAFNPDGSVKWSYDKESITADPAVDDRGNVYLRLQNNLTALDKDGKELWKCEAKGSSSTENREKLHQTYFRKHCFEDHAPRMGADGTVYILASGDGIGKEDGGVTAVRDGREIWRSKAYPSADKGPRFIVKNGNIYVSRIDKEQRKTKIFFTEDVQRDVIACLKPDGSEKFHIYLSEQYAEGSTNPEEAKQFSVANDGSIYVSNNPQSFTKFSSDGEKLWEHKVDSKNTDTRLQSPPIPTGDGNLILASRRRKLSTTEMKTVITGMDSNGKVNWEKDFDGKIIDDPRIAPNGDIFIKTNEKDNVTDAILHLSKDGNLIEKFTAKRGNRDIEAIRSFSFGPDGSLSVETLHSDGYDKKWSHKREISILPPAGERLSTAGEKNDSDQESGKIEKMKEFVVINGVKVPVNKRK